MSHGPRSRTSRRVARRDVADVRREAVVRDRARPSGASSGRGRPSRRSTPPRSPRSSRRRRRPRVCSGAERPEPEAVDEARLGGRRERVQRTSAAREVRAVQPGAVDLAGRDDAHGDPRRAARRPRGRAPRAPPGASCFESFRQRERANAVVAQRARSRAGRRRRRAARRASRARPRRRRRRSERRACGRSSAASARLRRLRAGSSASGSALVSFFGSGLGSSGWLVGLGCGSAVPRRSAASARRGSSASSSASRRGYRSAPAAPRGRAPSSPLSRASSRASRG